MNKLKQLEEESERLSERLLSTSPFDPSYQGLVYERNQIEIKISNHINDSSHKSPSKIIPSRIGLYNF